MRPTAIIDGITTRYEVIGAGPPHPDVCARRLRRHDRRNGRTQGVYAKIKLLDHLPKHYTCIAFDRRECGQSGGRVERVDLGALRRAGQRPARSSRSIERAHIMGGCMGVLLRDGVRRHPSEDDAEPDPVLAGGRREVPPVEPPAFRRAPRLRAAARARGRGRAGRQGRQTVRRRSARRTVGRRSSGTTAPLPRPTPSRMSTPTS